MSLQKSKRQLIIYAYVNLPDSLNTSVSLLNNLLKQKPAVSKKDRDNKFIEGRIPFLVSNKALSNKPDNNIVSVTQNLFGKSNE